MLRSVRNDATQRTIWSAPLYRKNFMALYYDLPVFLFCAILIFIDLTKKQVGGILKERKCPILSVVSTFFGDKAVQYIANVWAALLFNSFYLLSKKGMSE